MTLLYMWPDSFICVTWLFHMCNPVGGAFYLRHDSFISATWLLYMRDMTHCPYDSFICAIWLLQKCNMIPSYVPTRRSVDYVCHIYYQWVMSHMNESWSTWMSHVGWYTWVKSWSMCMSVDYVWHIISTVHLWPASFTCVIWPLHTCDATLSIWHVTFISSKCTFIYVTWLLCMFVKLDSFICATP